MMRLRHATSDPGLSRVAELSPLLSLLECRSGERLLDLGGPLRLSSRLLVRLGYVADAPALPDRSRLGCLPYSDMTFDGAIGVGTLSRVGDAACLLAEVCRVLKPGARAVLSEWPRSGSRGWVAEWQSRVDLAHVAHRAGLRTVEFHEGTNLSAGPLPLTTAVSSCVVLVRNGARALTSRRPGVLRGSICAEPIRAPVAPNQTVVIRAAVENTGDTVWLREPSRFGGFVTVVCKLLSEAGVLVDGGMRRRRLPADVPPTARARAVIRFRVPPAIAPGSYTLLLELWNEMVCAFSELEPGSEDRLKLEVREG